MSLTIRLYESADASAVAQVFQTSIRTIATNDYLPEQVTAWLANAPTLEQFAAMNADGRLTLVAVDEANQVVAFIDLECDGHIDMLYALPSVAGTGITISLYEQIELHARQQQLTRLFTEASEAARRFFLRRGFVEKHRRDLKVGGVLIHNYAMEKALR
ncbi:MAG: GNAT family N-acetyltransferase [Pseudomonadaceae bacterium]|nr:GNAT family N-acetyltransferase [Pseudomonadaceae bacterium]